MTDKQIKKIIEALEFYENKDNWKITEVEYWTSSGFSTGEESDYRQPYTKKEKPIDNDKGKCARKALKEWNSQSGPSIKR